ncbi:MAG: heme o synthase [Bdellovibrionales bacterium]|nr:heme o synthase [Bdellovibrionales bacterium]
MKAFMKLTKFGIVLFALVSALAGYAMSFREFQEFNFSYPLLLIFGLYFVCSGSFALNQAIEWRLDKLMPRTQSRPIPLGVMAPWQAWTIGIFLLLFGLFVLLVVNPLTALLSLLTVIMYNGFYTMYFKRKMAFGAVPGAIPGAMPVVIGYSVNSSEIFSPECLYLFLIMFLWQMPHFWVLAIRFKDDYSKAGFPVLPAVFGSQKTLYHIGLYLFVYAGLAMVSPWFLKANILYLFLVFPLSVKLIVEFFKYFNSKNEKNWLPFFLWVNISLLVFIGAPVFDKWLHIIVK